MSAVEPLSASTQASRLVEPIPLDTRTPHDLEILPLGEINRRDSKPVDLTPYVAREPDRNLVQIVTKAAAGSSGMVTVVGGPSTGKKRSLWEAIHTTDAAGLLLRDWNVWPGISPRKSEELLASIEELPPRTILWLPSAHRYFGHPNPEIGDEIARRIRELLRDPRRGPCLVLATLRQEHWRALTAPADQSAAGPATPHARLLLQYTNITLRDAFTDAEVAQATESGDYRLLDAAECASGRQVIQNLVAAPELQTRYETASTGASAVLRCAVDARHVGHGVWLSPELLAGGAECFLREWSAPQTEGWFDEALDELTRAGSGGTAVLIGSPSAAPSMLGAARRRYRLHPSLDRRHVLGSAKPALPRPDFWSVLLTVADRENQRLLARECARRHLLQLSTQFYLNAADTGDRSARTELADLLGKAGRIDDAFLQYQQVVASDSADPVARKALGEGARTLLSAGRTNELFEWLEPYAKAGNQEAAKFIAVAYTTRNSYGNALRVYQDLAVRGNLDAAAVAADIMAEQNNSAHGIDKAVRWLFSLADDHGLEILPVVTDFLLDNDNGGVGKTLDALATRGEAGHHNAYLSGAELLASEGRFEDSMRWLETASKYNVPGAKATAVRVYLEAGLFDTGVRLAREAAEAGNAKALVEAADALTAAGMIQHALDCYHEAASQGETTAFSAAAFAAATAGLIDDVDGCYRRARAMHSAPAAEEIAGRLCESGHVDMGLEWYLSNVTPTPDALVAIARHITTLPHVELVAAICAARTRAGNSRIHTWVGEALHRYGRAESDTSQRQATTGSSTTHPVPRQLALAEEVYVAAAWTGFAPALSRAVRLLLDHRKFMHAQVLLNQNSEDVRPHIQALRAETLAHLGDFEPAMRIVEEQLNEGHPMAVAGVAAGLAEHDRAVEAAELAARGVSLGDVPSHIVLADIRYRQEERAGVIDLYCFALAHGHPDARERIERVMGAHQERDWNIDPFLKNGLDESGHIARPWTFPRSERDD